MPEDLDFGGQKIRFLIYYPISMFGENDGDLINSAIFERNNAVMEKLNIELEYVQDDDVMKTARGLILSGDGSFDFAGSQGRWFVPIFSEGAFFEISDLPYVNINNPWWNKTYIEAASINIHKPNLLFGDIDNLSYDQIVGTYFNKRIMGESIGLDEKTLYNGVLDGTWTVDRFIEYSQNVYRDLNGNGKYDADDLYPFFSQVQYSFEFMIYGAGLQFTSRDADGYPVIDMNNDRTIGLFDKLLPVFMSDECYKSDQNISTQRFAAGNEMMLLGRFYSASWPEMREMEDDFCLIPTPKYNESIDNYYCVIAGGATWSGILITSQNLEAVSAAVEAMGYYGYKDVRSVYFESVLKFKYMRDSSSPQSQIIDIMIDNARSDFLYCYAYSGMVGKMPTIVENIFKKKENVFSSLYESYEASTITALEKFKAEN